MSTNPRIQIRGFTLVELMVAMVLALFLIGGVILMYLSSQTVATDARQLSRMQENVRFASDYIIRDLRNAGFSDQLSLTSAEDLAIRQQIALVTSDSVTVRYAGRGHCAAQFEKYVPVQNRYFINPQKDTDELLCQGCLVEAELVEDAVGNAPPQLVVTVDESNCNTTTLVTGVSRLSARVIRPSGAMETAAACGTASAPCIGLEVGLEFAGLRDLNATGDENRYVELYAAFRNAALPRIFSD